MGRVLTFNCHESYVHLLGKLGVDLDVVDGLPGRYTSRWDERMRPVPERARLIRLEQALPGSRYDVAIAHNISDLLLLRDFDLPKILVLHVSLAARAAEERNAPPIERMREQLHVYLNAIAATAVAVSEMKARSWGQDCPVVRPCADPEEYAGFEGTEPVLLRVANQVMQRPRRFAWEEHCRMVAGLELNLVGHNPEIAGSTPASSWEALRNRYRLHRAYVHSAAAGLDDGYNLGVVEAMTTGMPVVSLEGSESPIVDGINGFVSADPGYLNTRLRELVADRRRAVELGRRARDTALQVFSLEAFLRGWHAAFERARATWRARARAAAPH